MSHDPLPPISPIGGADQVQGTAGSGRSDGAEFRRLLEKLEGMRTDDADPAGTTDSPESLVQDLAKADDDFMSVMDLRRRLEEAFRSKNP